MRALSLVLVCIELVDNEASSKRLRQKHLRMCIIALQASAHHLSLAKD